MSKGLEALERIKTDMEYVTRLDFVEPIVRGEVQQELYRIYHREEKDLDIIEQELKDYEQHEEILNDYGLTLANFREACLLLAMLKGEKLNIHDIAKQLKALEIIKETFVPYDIEMLKNGKVRIWVGHDKYSDVSKEQFDLLKEVLL